MLGQLMPDRTELIHHYCYLYGRSPDEAAQIIDRALEAASHEKDLRRPLLGWLMDHNWQDVDIDGVSLSDTAQLLCRDYADVPVACYLAYLHRCHGMAGILTLAAHECEVEDAIVYHGAPPRRIRRKDGQHWQLFADGRGQMINFELWRVIEQYPQLLTRCLRAGETGEWTCGEREVTYG